MREKRLIYTLLALTVLPHIFHLPLLLNLYLLLFVIYLFFGKNYKIGILLFATLGVIFGFVEYVRYINITDLSKAKVFIDIVSSLLIYLTSLLILDRFSSPFLKVAPILLLLTSLFYFENLFFLFYAIFVLFVAIVGIVYTNSNISLKSATRYSFSMFIASLPIVVVLFFAFPRISYKAPSFGFRAGENLITGFGDSISFGSGRTLLQSNKVAMEIMFKKEVPPPSKLYFRGEVLYKYQNGLWRASKFSHPLPPKLKGEKQIPYTAIIYPTLTEAIAQLDYPLNYPKEAKETPNYTLKLKKPLFKSKRFEFESILDANLSYIDSRIKFLSLYLPPTDSKTKRLAEKILNSSKDKKEAVKRLKEFFISSKIVYTLSPPELKSKNQIDEFLFKTKRGYCVHLASSFTFMLRAMGIPARVVSGYKAGKSGLLNRYLLIRAKDAHSWVEAYLEGRWVRIDPTAFAIITRESNSTKDSNPFWEKVTLKLMYFKYKIEEWVLYYSKVKQIKLLEMLRGSSKLLLIIVGSLLSLILLGIYFSKIEFSKKDKLSLLWDKLLKKLEKEGFKREPFEGDKSFAKRVGDEEFERLTWMYLKLKYSSLSTLQREKLYKELKRAIKLFRLEDSSHKQN